MRKHRLIEVQGLDLLGLSPEGVYMPALQIARKIDVPDYERKYRFGIEDWNGNRWNLEPQFITGPENLILRVTLIPMLRVEDNKDFGEIVVEIPIGDEMLDENVFAGIIHGFYMGVDA